MPLAEEISEHCQRALPVYIRLYIEKNRTIPLLRRIGLTIASRELLQSGSAARIAFSGNGVNNAVYFLCALIAKSAIDVTHKKLENQQKQRKNPHFCGLMIWWSGCHQG